MRRSKQLYRELEIADSVIWSGFVEDPRDLAMYLSTADVCVLPIDIGIQLNNSSFAAAAASGLPIVTTRGPRLESPFVHGQNVLLCPPKDSAALADAITAVVDDPALRRRLTEGALALAKEWFSWEAAIDRLESAMVAGSAGKLAMPARTDQGNSGTEPTLTGIISTRGWSGRSARRLSRWHVAIAHSRNRTHWYVQNATFVPSLRR